MDYYDYRNYKDFFTQRMELSRADLVLMGIVLGFFATMLAASLDDTNGLGDLALRLIATLAVAAGAIASLRGVLQWGVPADQVKANAENVRASKLNRSYETDVFDSRSKAA